MPSKLSILPLSSSFANDTSRIFELTMSMTNGVGVEKEAKNGGGRVYHVIHLLRKQGLLFNVRNRRMISCVSVFSTCSSDKNSAEHRICYRKKHKTDDGDATLARLLCRSSVTARDVSPQAATNGTRRLLKHLSIVTFYFALDDLCAKSSFSI